MPNSREILDLVQIEEALTDLEGWEYKANRLERVFRTGSFMAGLSFVQEIAGAAEQANHHPDVFLSYPRVKVQLWTHDVNGITKLDVQLAAKINELAIEQAIK